MKSRGFAVVYLCVAFMAGCNKPVVVFPSPDPPVASAYAPEKGDVIEWDAHDPTQDFEIVLDYSPTPMCSESDTLHTDVKNKITKVICHTIANGTFYYEIKPIPSTDDGVKATTVKPFAQVGSCTGNCTGHGLELFFKQHRQIALATDLINISCTDKTTVGVANSPSNATGNDVLKWRAVNGSPATFGAIFISTNASGQPVNSPCSGNSYGPFYGLDNYCTIDPNAAKGDYYYTATDSDCPTSGTPTQIKVTVQ